MSKGRRMRAVFCSVIALAVSQSAFAQMRKADTGEVREALQARMEEAQRLAAIEENKAEFVAGLLDQWEAEATSRGYDAFVAKGTRKLMARSARDLNELATRARDFDTFHKLVFDGYRFNVLGDLTQDLVYVPINACRLYDSRFATGAGLAGPMAPGTQRDISVNDSTGTTQGGASPDCGTTYPDLNNDPPALALSLSAVLPTGPGNLRTFAVGAAVPNAAMLSYTAGANITTGVITSSCTSCGSELTVRNQGAGNTDVVVDIVGYFHAPHVTALDCTTLNSVTAAAAGAAFNATSPVCTAGYTLTGGGFDVNLGGTPDNDWFRSAPNALNTAWECQGINATAFNVNITCYARCCRVPGR